MISSELKENSKNTLKQGSKSFAFAALFFSKETREDVSHLYSWCRKCDDITDGSLLGFNQNPHGLPLDRVDILKEMSLQAIQDPHPKMELPFLAFGEVMKKYQIPWIYADDLLAGMKHDLESKPIHDRDALILYCYRVAGTVGLMMCHLMGIKNSRALKWAVDLGIALQLTNIARDIGDDYRVGKIYLPETWLHEYQIPKDQLTQSRYSRQLEALCQKLLSEADTYYSSGLQGLIDLPWRSALSVAIATSVYRTIGYQVLRKGSSAWTNRVVLGKKDKLMALFKGISLFLKTIPSRVLEPRSTTPIDCTWRYL